MHVDNSVLLILVLNISMILALSWIGLKIVNYKFSDTRLNNDRGTTQVSKIVKEASFITPRIKTSFRVRRMIKTNMENDETPFFLPQLA
jgi:hypothetical protein